ncbi:hypothetical protein LEMLEM_LOCUS23229, partial [Lemmus lemmus]
MPAIVLFLHPGCGKSLASTPLSPQYESRLDKRLETHLRKCLQKIWLGLAGYIGIFGDVSIVGWPPRTVAAVEWSQPKLQ